jgi:hypothetical protein
MLELNLLVQSVPWKEGEVAAATSVNVRLLRLDCDRQKRNPLFLQCFTLPGDEVFVVWRD